MKEFTFRLKADVSYLEEQFKGAAAELAKMAVQAGKTEKKLEVFQEANAYLIQMENMLGKIQKQYPDLFDKIFDGVDKQVKDALAPFKQMPEVIGQALDQVGAKMQDVLSGKNKAATVSEIKEWSKSIKHAADALDIKIDFGFLDDKKSSKAKVEDMVSVLKQLREAYKTTSDAAQRANLAPIVPEVKEKKRTKKKNAVVEENVDNGANIPGSVNGVIKPQKVNELTNSYIKLAQAVQRIKDLSLDDTMDHDDDIEKELKNIQNAFKISTNEMMKFDDVLNNTEDSFEDTFGKVKELLGAKFPTLSLDDITNSVQRFVDIQKELENVQTDDEFAKLDDEANNIRDLFAKLSVESEEVFDGLMNDLQKDDAVKQLTDLFGIDILQSAKTAGDAVSSVEVNIKGTGEAADDATAKIKVLEDSINEIVRNASKHKLEFSVVLNGEDVTVRKGKDKTTTDIVETTGNMMSSLGKYFVDSHTHTTTSKTTNDADLKSFARLKKYGVTDHNAIFGPDGVSTYDFSQVSNEDMQKAIQMVEELGKSGNVTNKQLIDIFKTLNDGYDVVKHFDTDNIGEFAKYIDDVTKNAQKSIDPLKQFKGIVDYLTGGRVDWSKHSEVLEGFQPENAKDIFDKIVRTETNGKIDIYDFDKKSFADVITELSKSNTAGQQLTGTLNDVGQASNGASASIKNLGEEIDEALAQETGDLESKLERLKDLADEYGNNITQRDRNSLESLIDQDNEKELTGSKADRLSDLQEKIDEADEALAAFEEQYDKIILKLENGKKVEILPNDKGLRDLYKFMDEGDGESFGGIGVEDVEFIRKVSAATEDATNEIYEQIKSYEELNAVIKRYNELALKRVSEGAGISKQEENEMSSISNRLMHSFAGEDPDKALDFLMKFNGATNQILGTIEFNKIANILGIEIPQAAGIAENAIESQAEEANQKLREQEDLYQQVRTAIKGTLEEVVGMDYTAVALEDIEREIKDGLITTLEEAIIRFKEMNNLTDDISIRPVGEYQRVADYWDSYQGNKYVDEDNETVINKNEYESLKQKTSTEDVGQEYKDLETLRQKISEVEAAIVNKTLAFHQEADAVEVNVRDEIDRLELLRNKLEEIKVAVDNKTNAFEAEKNAIVSSVANELTELNKLKEKLDVIAGQVKAIGKISIVDQQKEKKLKEKKSKPLDDTPIKGEQIGMDLDTAVQDTKELAAAEEKIEAAVEQTNDALDKQISKSKEVAIALDLSKQIGTLNFLSKELKDSAGALSENWSDDDKEHYEQLISIINTYRKSKEKMTDDELGDIRKIVNGYKAQAEAVRKVEEETKKSSNIFGLKELKKASERNVNLNAISKDFDSKVVTDGLENVRQSYQRLVEYQQKFNDGHAATDVQKEEYKSLANQYNAAAKELEGLFKTSQKMFDNSRWSVDIDQSGLDNLEESMKKAIQASENGKVKFSQFNAETGQLEYSVRRANGTWDHFTAQVDEAGMAVVGLNGKIKTTNGIIRDFTGGIATKFKNAMQVFSGYDLFFEGVAQVKKGIQYVRDIDTALTELKKVTNETDEAYAQFLQTASKTAGVVGSTVKDITTMTADWSRLGYSMQQASALAESTAVLLNVSEFNDATQASEALISTIQAYGYAADESMDVVNVLNEVGKFIARR